MTARLLKNNIFKDVELIANPGYELLYNNSICIGKILFLICGIRKQTGVFGNSDEIVATVKDISIKKATSYCTLGYTEWDVTDVGYCWTGGDTIVISDKNKKAIHTYAFINLAIKIT